MTASFAERFLYGGKPAEVRPAAGTKGVLIQTLDGRIVLRVRETGDAFTDYELRHDDLSVTIGADELASFYEVGEDRFLDHSPEVLGLEKSGE